jgi:beta-galactosidase
MGFLVINETFDEWRRGWDFVDGELVSSPNKGKARFGYHLYFDEWAERDLADHIRRDRNHPSVIMWSIGNEVPEAQKFGEIETVRRLRDLCHKLDPTRPVTAGINHIQNANDTGFLEFLDVVGYNGGGGSCFLYEEDHARFPQAHSTPPKCPHSLQTRGEYRTRTSLPRKERQPAHLTEARLFPETDAWYESSYDNAAVRINARDSWRLTSTLPFVAGEFRWTGFDYIGESGGWPRVLGNFGVIDLCNFPKDTYYFYQSQWTDKPMVHLLPHWTWPGKDGVVIPVFCYTTCDEAELVPQWQVARRRGFSKDPDMHLTSWMVPYAPGELKGVARKDGQVEIATAVTRTAGRAGARGPWQRTNCNSTPTRRDLSYLTIRIEDEDGRFVPAAAAG